MESARYPLPPREHHWNDTVTVVQDGLVGRNYLVPDRHLHVRANESKATSIGCQFWNSMTICFRGAMGAGISLWMPTPSSLV
ncbi:hypothetical protein AVEN_137616-1 [Araneus ventricosus]|uniref:Uncharacterized protein n=1 Tax=Araneus ventricosus TaxID=182803 RepID=A0A4Y2CVA0_ARAVE|nr:hypothetical protein AVEN_137616-1 [Araneus ventricosus]